MKMREAAWIACLIAVAHGGARLCNNHKLCVHIVEADRAARLACSADALCVAPPPFECESAGPALGQTQCSVDDCAAVLAFAADAAECRRWFAAITDDQLHRLAKTEEAKLQALRSGNATAAAAAGVHPAVVAARQAAIAAGYAPPGSSSPASSAKPARP